MYFLFLYNEGSSSSPISTYMYTCLLLYCIDYYDDTWKNKNNIKYIIAYHHITMCICVI